MKKLFILSFILLFSTSINAQTNGKPLTKEQIEALESLDEVTESFDAMDKAFNSMMKARNNSCLKAFGHEIFCKCLNENLAIYNTPQKLDRGIRWMLACQ